MSPATTQNKSKLTLSYGEGGPYSLAKVSPDATPESLMRTAKSISAFQEGSLKDVFSYVEKEIGPAA